MKTYIAVSIILMVGSFAIGILVGEYRGKRDADRWYAKWGYSDSDQTIRESGWYRRYIHSAKGDELITYTCQITENRQEPSK